LASNIAILELLLNVFTHQKCFTITYIYNWQPMMVTCYQAF